MPETSTVPNSLHEALSKAFDLGELKTLCFDTQVEYDDLPGETRQEKVRELLRFLERTRRQDALLLPLQKQRPLIAWDSFYPAMPDATPPFRGLYYFDVEDTHLFFGREKLTGELVEHLRQHRFLAVVGASGSGKSSLVRAGVAAAIQGGGSRATWPIHIITPGDEPLKALAASLTRDSESVTATATLLDDLRQNSQSLDLFLYRQMSDQPEGRLLLIVDQFEELFTQCDDSDVRMLFVENLVNAVQSGKQGRLRLVLTLRADFYTYAVQYEALRPLLETRQKIVGAMNPDELRRAIEAPAEQGNWQFQPGLVETILQDVGREPGALPLLSHALQETWTRREGRILTLAGYQAAGGVRRAIAQTADNVYASLTPEQQAIARNIFLRLTELGEGTEDTRRRASLAELLPQNDTTTKVQAVLDLLSRKRLLTLNEERAKEGVAQAYAEVAHEALIREWPALRTWLDENREGLRLHRQLTDIAEAWQAAGEEPSYLYWGGRLAQAQEWAGQNPAVLNDLERRFLTTSQQSAEQEATEEKAQYQRELEQARQLAQAERLARRRTYVALGVTILFALILSITPTKNEWYRQQAKNVPMAKFHETVAWLGSEASNPTYMQRQEYQIGAFQIEVYEVTNQRYSFCVNAQACSRPAPPKDTYESPDRQQYPVTNITAIQAREFCQWIDRDLPTNIQWEWSARYPNGRSWPWGNTPKPSSSLALMPFGSFIPTSPQEVNSYGAGISALGIYHLVGNVREWTRSDYSSDAEWDEDEDPTDTLSVRGGSFENDILDISQRASVTSKSSFPDIGFRCVESD